MSAWRKCDTCRKVRQTEEFEAESPTCRACLTAPARRKAAPVTRTVREPRAARPAQAAPASPAPRRALLGAVGAGDLEVRERRAKRSAYEALAAAHPDDFHHLLNTARQAEGLRPLPGPVAEEERGEG